MGFKRFLAGFSEEVLQGLLYGEESWKGALGAERTLWERILNGQVLCFVLLEWKDSPLWS